jgi:DNA mismatch repair protein MutS2
MARAFGGRAARLPGRGGADELVLRAARHPVLASQERAGEIARVVPLDLRLGGEFDQLLVTGPNTGGKTLVLKTVGVCVLATRCGLPILADEGSTVPLYRGIAADIGDEQEVAQSLSTFASHVKRLGAGLARARPDVLFLLDEVGGATDPAEGAALGEALLEHLLRVRAPTLPTTHLAVLVEYAWRHARVENASVEFDVATLAPTYRLRVGTPGSSQALVIARRLGLPPELVDRARERMTRPDDDVAAAIRELGAARAAAEDARSRAEALAAGAAQRERELARREEEHEVRAKGLLAEVDAELERRLTAARGELEAALTGLDTALAAGGLSPYREAFFARLSKGDSVWLPRYGRRCHVTRIDAARRRLVVRLGQRDVEVGFDDAAAFEAL